MIIGRVVAASYGALGSVPGLRINRAMVVIVSAAALIGLGAISLAQAWLAINPDTLVFLLSMMLLNAYLSYAGCLRWALVALVRLGRMGVLVGLTGVSGLLSAFLLNDTLALV